MASTSPEQNTALVLKAVGTLFNRRDYVGAERAFVGPRTDVPLGAVSGDAAALGFPAGSLAATGGLCP